MAERKINGRTFRVDPLLATEALRLQARLARALGPVAVKLPGILSGRGEHATEEQKAKSDSEAIAAFTGVFADMEPDEYATLIKDVVELAKLMRPSGQYDTVDLDGDFVGDSKSIYPVAFFVLETQFADFFGANLANGLRKGLAKG